MRRLIWIVRHLDYCCSGCVHPPSFIIIFANHLFLLENQLPQCDLQNRKVAKSAKRCYLHPFLAVDVGRLSVRDRTKLPTCQGRGPAYTRRWTPEGVKGHKSARQIWAAHMGLTTALFLQGTLEEPSRTTFEQRQWKERRGKGKRGKGKDDQGLWMVTLGQFREKKRVWSPIHLASS